MAEGARVVEPVAQLISVLADRYRLTDLIGQGGMSDVYLGTDERLGRKVAVKLLKASLAEDPEFRARFRREAQDAAKMAHPTIVRVFDAGEEFVTQPGGRELVIPYIVMEYVDGRLLRDMLNEGPIDPAEAARIVQGVLTALEYSHRAGVVHRDIKPGNVMITRSGDVKVMDFGIARAVTDTSATIAQTSAIVGTAQYFSPEQARGETVDARTDLYSTGVLLFELVTGRAPFRGDNPVAVAYQHVNAAPPSPSGLNPDVSPALDAVVLRSLAKARSERYQTATEFRDDVASAAAGETPTAFRPGTATGAVPRFEDSLFGIDPAAATTGGTAIRRLALDQPERLSRTQNRPPVAWIWAGIAAMIAIVVAVVFWTFNLDPQQLTPRVSEDVPEIIGQVWEDGERALDEVGLESQRFSQADPDVPEGEIVRVDPAPGIAVQPGSRVRVYVSTGPDLVAIPDVSGMTESAAIDAITAAGFTYGSTTTEDSPDVPVDRVFETDPSYPDEAESGAVVDISVSNGRVTVPDLIDETYAEAESILAELGLTLLSYPCAPESIIDYQEQVGVVAQGSSVTLGCT